MKQFQRKKFESENEVLLIDDKPSKEEKTLKIAFAIDSSLDDFNKKAGCFISTTL